MKRTTTTGPLVDGGRHRGSVGAQTRRHGRKMTVKSTLLWAGLTAASALAFAGCGSSSSSSSSAGSSGGAGPAPSTFVIAIDAHYATLDPDQSIEEPPLQVLNLLGGNLTRFNPDGTHISPDLASGWNISSDKLTYTFTLRPGLKFSNGTPIHASDFVASYTREQTDKSNQNIGLTANWQSWSAPNDRTVVLTLKSPAGSTLSYLADPELGVVFPAADITQKSFWTEPISAGRYKLASFDPSNGDASLTVNSNYWGPRPGVKTMKFVYVGNPTTRIVQLKSGQINFAEDLSPDTLSSLSGSTTGTLTQGYGGYYLVMNNRTGALANANVRKAITLVIDRNQLNNVLFAGKAHVLRGYTPTTMTGNQQLLPATPQISQAKSLLAGTPCANGCTIPIMVRNGTPLYQNEATVIQQNLKKIGISMPLQLTDDSIADQKAYKGDFQLYTGGLWDYANRPDGMLTWGLNYNGGLFSLYSGYKSSKVDSLTKTAIATTGLARVNALHQINAIFNTNTPYAPLLDWTLTNGQTTSTLSWVKFEPTSFFKVASK